VPRAVIGWLATAIWVIAAAAAPAAEPDWASLGELDTVRVVTTDEDGSERDTKVWLVVVDGVGYVRTGSTTWGENVVRSRELALRAGEASYALRVDFVEDDAARARITDAFRAKYGFSDRMVSWMRGARPKIMRLSPKE
jgi:hypothetical protein